MKPNTGVQAMGAPPGRPCVELVDEGGVERGMS